MPARVVLVRDDSGAVVGTVDLDQASNVIASHNPVFDETGEVVAWLRRRTQSDLERAIRPHRRAKVR